MHENGIWLGRAHLNVQNYPAKKQELLTDK